MRVSIVVLFLSFTIGYSANNASSHYELPTVAYDGSEILDCADPNGYGVVEDRGAEGNLVKIVQGDKVFKTIKLPTGVERNGFGFNWAKKTKEGFEISIEYGSRYYLAQFHLQTG